MAKQHTNTRFASGISTTDPNAATWVMFDALPAIVRRALHEAPVSINPASVSALLSGGACFTVRAIRDAAKAEIEAFDRDHARRHGYALPHVAADVSVQPYEVRSSASLSLRRHLGRRVRSYRGWAAEA